MTSFSIGRGTWEKKRINAEFAETLRALRRGRAARLRRRALHGGRNPKRAGKPRPYKGEGKSTARNRCATVADLIIGHDRQSGAT
jgi:hypothetical protein